MHKSVLWSVTVAVVAAGCTREPATTPTPQGRSPTAEQEISLDLGGGVMLELVPIPPGKFLMGAPDSDKASSGGADPRHWVRITRPFYLGKYEVTQEQWQAVMGSNPSAFPGPKNPVEQVSWEDCQQLLDKLSAKFGPGLGKFQLPTEAQWEYACRAGSTTRYCCGDEESGLGEYAWYGGRSGRNPHPAGQKKANAWGLYDMHGNVWEWCADWYDRDYYANSPEEDPAGPAKGAGRVRRGGCWYGPARYCRSAHRYYHDPGHRDDLLGVRACLVPVDK